MIHFIRIFAAVDFLDAMRKRVQKFEVQYIGNLPVSRAMGTVF